MAKPENDDSFPEKHTWGTWEELLLACAVHRHGTESWSSVSAEIQKRSPNLRSLTASACRHKYFDLKRRFTRELALPGSGELESVPEISNLPWLEELRRLRVDELRREVEQYDLSISSLQSKVKKLEEEREMSLNEPYTEIENSDLDKIVEKIELRRESDSDSGELVPKSPVQLVNESISPDPKDNSPGTGSANVKRDEEMAGFVDGESKPAGEDSCRGSCESVEKESAGNSERVEPGRGTELTESMAESEGGANRGEEDWKETSDVQSSASLPIKGTSEQDGPVNEDQSPSAKDFPVESQPSFCFVEILRSRPCGAHFWRRLETQLQETPEYGQIIRQHVDFEMIRKRVEEGWYKSSMSKLFRDLLLLINNARVFYHKSSSEFKSAEQLHHLVKKHMASHNRPREISPPKQKSLELVALEEGVAVSSKPVSVKPRMSVPIIACRKRTSLAAKPLLSSPPGPDKKSKKTDQLVDDEKPVSGKDETSGEDDESLISKKMTRGKTSSDKKVAIRNVKNRDSSLNVDDNSKGRVSSEAKKTDEEKKGNNSNKSGSSKKKSAASFLKRMKVGSSSDTVVETLKPSSATDSSTTGKGVAEQRKNSSNKAETKKRATTTTGKSQTNEKGSPVKKKNNGRALKREAASSSTSSPMLGKRSREAGEKEAASSPSSTRSKKRVRM